MIKQNKAITIESTHTVVNHTLNIDAFKKLRKPWFWMSLSLSFLIDSIAIAAYGYDYIIAATDVFTTLLQIAFVLFVNALVFKGLIFYFYYKLREMRMRSIVIESNKDVCYHRYSTRSGSSEGSSTLYLYSKITIRNITRIIIRKNGTIVIHGMFAKTNMIDSLDQPESVQSRSKKVNKVSIPAYYHDMESLVKCLRTLQNKKIRDHVDL